MLRVGLSARCGRGRGVALAGRWGLSTAAPKREVKLAVFSHESYMNQAQITPLKKAFPATKVLSVRLSPETVPLAKGSNAVCAFVNDDLSAETLEALRAVGVECIAMRCAGYDRVDLAAATSLGMKVLRVPAYSPYAVAEHSVALALALNRQLFKAEERVRVGNFSLSGLVGFTMHGRTVGIVGTGKIGICAMAIYRGLGCKILAYDVHKSEEAIQLGATYVDLETLFREAQIVSLHCPMIPATEHLINEKSLKMMRNDAMLINVSRGGLIDTAALINAMDNREIAAVALDVYEKEAASFFKDLSVSTDYIPGASLPLFWDKTLANLATRPNVIVTPHQAFLTAEALSAIATTTILNLNEFATDGPYTNDVVLK